MKITSTETVEVCDICRIHKNPIHTCIICNKKICFLCYVNIPGQIWYFEICKKCWEAHSDYIRKVLDKYFPVWKKMKRKVVGELKLCRRKSK